MCIQINTQFIQMLIIKKILNSYTGRETQTHVMMKEWLMFSPHFLKGLKCTESTEEQ